MMKRTRKRVGRMKAILMSIQAKHLVNILNGKKTLEIRKSVPVGFKGWVYLYCTKAKPYIDKKTLLTVNVASFNGEQDLNGFVVARFWLDEYDLIECDSEQHKAILDASCITFDEIINYCAGRNLYAWYIKNLEILDKPKELRDFYNYKFYQTLYSSFNFGIKNDSLFNKNLTFEDYIKKFDDFVKIKSAPQSWMYVEAVE